MPDPMSFFRRARRALRSIIGRPAIDDEMQSEMRQHLEHATERLRARGMSKEDAEAEARKEFGNVSLIQEEARDARGARWVDALAADLRFAVRYFARHKAIVAIIVVVLALGTGANTLIFSIFQSEFLRPAPAMPDIDAHARFVARERLTKTGSWERRDFTYVELQTLASRRDLFSDVTGWTQDEVILGGDSTAARGMDAQFVTPNYFRVVGASLAAGAGFAQHGTTGADLTAVMAYAVAEQTFGSPAVAVGRRILVNEVPVRIVGVAPFRFQGALRNMDEPGLWIPLSARADLLRVSPRWLETEASMGLLARMARGASHEQATAFARQIVNNTLPDSAQRVGMARNAFVLGMNERMPGADFYELLMAFGAISVIGILVLLVAWMNVSSLMVAAAVGRRHEIAVRLSLGASRLRILRQLVTESTLLALAGGALGSLLAWWVLVYITKTDVDGTNILPDFATFAFTFGIAIASGILFGLSPALHATRGVAAALRDSGAGTTTRSRLQRTFMAAQIMLSQPLLVLLGAMVSLVISDYKPLAEDMSRRVIEVRARPLQKTGALSQRGEGVDSLIFRIRQRPEVVGAVPGSNAFAFRSVATPGVPAEIDTMRHIVHIEGTSPGWFSVLDVRLVFGTDVAWADTSATDWPVVIGSDMARAMFGDVNPVGRTLASPGLTQFQQDSIVMRVVGVYDATQQLPGMVFNGATARTNSPFRAYTARGKHWRHDLILVRTGGPAEPFLPELQKFVRAVAPTLPVSSMRTLEQINNQEYLVTVRVAMLAGAGGALALLLASLGLYGVVSLAVQQRTREIGIRIAVGANPRRVAQMFLASGVRVSIVALLLGLPLSVAGLKIALSQAVIIAPGVNAYLIGAVIAVLLLLVASGATWLPARRAARVDPATTLRVE